MFLSHVISTNELVKIALIPIFVSSSESAFVHEQFLWTCHMLIGKTGESWSYFFLLYRWYSFLYGQHILFYLLHWPILFNPNSGNNKKLWGFQQPLWTIPYAMCEKGAVNCLTSTLKGKLSWQSLRKDATCLSIHWPSFLQQGCSCQWVVGYVDSSIVWHTIL